MWDTRIKRGLTRGTSADIFGSSDIATAAQYITFVLRALGYSEADGDFVWSEAAAYSDTLGLTSGEYGNSETEFLRADVVAISYHALAQSKKGGTVTLLQSLVSAGAVTVSAAQAAGLSSLLEGAAAQRK